MARVPSMPPALPGYTFVRVLGSGGFSDVFLYEQHLPKRRVAVKVLLTEELTDANRAAFVAEANLMAQLSAHPYIVSILHADVASDDRPYLVMEYCSGPSLSERYKRAPLPVVDVLRTGVRVAGAVATAHAAGILHRDIKPANILTNDYGWPALTDFGIASAIDDGRQGLPAGVALDAESTGSATQSASVGMSVPWSPPEMFEEAPRPDATADVFSLAATLHTLLSGRTPFEVVGGPNGPLDLIGRIERGLVTPIDRDEVPRSLVAVLRKGMATRREDRFVSVVEFGRALQRIELELGYQPTTIDVPNLVVDESVRGGTDDDDDATRARGVSTIDAQSAAPVIDAPPQAPIGDDTVVRPRVVAEPAAPPAAAAVPAEPSPTADVPAKAPQSRVNRVALWVGGAVLLLIAAAVTLALVIGGVPGPTGSGPSPSASSGGSAVVTKPVPTPVLATVETVGEDVRFTVQNPDEEDGDFIIWRRTDRGSDSPVQRVEGGQFTVSDAASSTACVEVRVVRSGRESAVPLERCHPE